MYSLLTPIRYVLNPRFHLSTPLQSGLFCIAPGCGYLTGTFFGGRWADRVVKKWIRIRGQRIPEDRLRSCLVSTGLVIPCCMLIYGWSVEKKKGGSSHCDVHSRRRPAVLLSVLECLLFGCHANAI